MAERKRPALFDVETAGRIIHATQSVERSSSPVAGKTGPDRDGYWRWLMWAKVTGEGEAVEIDDEDAEIGEAFTFYDRWGDVADIDNDTIILLAFVSGKWWALGVPCNSGT